MNEKALKAERMKKIGEQIYLARKKCGYTREVLAEKSNISPNYLYNIEIGNKVPNVLIFLDICQALNQPTGILLNPALENRLIPSSKIFQVILTNYRIKKLNPLKTPFIF